MKAGRQGFTLLELLAVMAILAILIGLGAKGYSLAQRQAREGRARADLETIRHALEEYRLAYGRYPGAGHDGDLQSLSELEQLLQIGETFSVVDPWGRSYQYRHAGGVQARYLYSLWSLGQDSDVETDDIHSSSHE